MTTRVLVVDDEAPIQRFLKPALTASGYEVLTAENGRQALHLIATAAPDIGVLDLGLPDIDAEGLSVDLDRRLVFRLGVPVKLTPKEYDLLAILVRHAGRVVTHRQILSQVWGPAHADDTQYLRVFIGQLRAKIEPDTETPKLLLTEPGIGYRLWAGEA